MPKATHKTPRGEIKSLTDIINVGPAIADDFIQLGIDTPQKLIGQDPLKLYQIIIRKSKQFHDPCVLDVFMASVDFMNGNPPRVWWDYTSERKANYTSEVAKLKKKFPI